MDPRNYGTRSNGRQLAPDRGSLGEELDALDGSACFDDDDDYLEESPETGHFPHDA